MKVFFILLSFIFLSTSLLFAADHAVVLLYHHVSADTPAATSVTPEMFHRHLDYLAAEDFHVLPLGEVLKTLAEGGRVPEKTVSITFDDAYRSILDQAMPLLIEKKWPFTVFVNTLAIDRGYRNYLGWDELRQLLGAGAEIGNHSDGHDHLVRRLPGESQQQWRKRVAEDILFAQQRLKNELAADVFLFAYPYGEHTPELKEIVGSLGFFGIAQQSGAVGYGFDQLAVPRFPMATNYADMNRFAMAVNSRPLPVTDISSGPVVQVAGKNSRYTFAFILLPGRYQTTGLSCYDSSGERLILKSAQGAGAKHVSVQLPDWGAGRRKINCTAPSSVEQGVYYWYSHLWLVKQADGQWYSE